MANPAVAIIGGTGLNEWPGAEVRDTLSVETPYGTPSAAPLHQAYGDAEFLFLARHGRPHRLPPHRINYRANLAALSRLGVRAVIAVNAVGGIGERYGAGCIAIPDQVIDYTHGREHTFHDGRDDRLAHVDFTWPYDTALCTLLREVAEEQGIAVTAGGVYGATQGPRLESAAEVRRLQRDGCDLIGMTGMPEAALAREAGIAYASLCLVVNPAAGQGAGEITMEDIQAVLDGGMGEIQKLLAAAVVKYTRRRQG